MKIDLMSISGHKLYGPKVLYCKPSRFKERDRQREMRERERERERSERKETWKQVIGVKSDFIKIIPNTSVRALELCMSDVGLEFVLSQSSQEAARKGVSGKTTEPRAIFEGTQIVHLQMIYYSK